MQCNSLDEVRTNIDRLDREIVKLIAERSRFVKEAARFKKTTDDVKAPARVETVINKVRALASEDGRIDPEIVEQVYRTMIGCFINFEMKEYQGKTE